MLKGLLSIWVLIFFQNSFAQNKDIEALTRLNRDWLNSYPKKDTATLQRIFADDFVLISPKGAKMTKGDIINNLFNQETVSVNVDSIDVRMLTGNVGLITAYTTFVLNAEGKEITGRNCYQDVYMKRGSKWQAVAAHVTLLGMK